MRQDRELTSDTALLKTGKLKMRLKYRTKKRCSVTRVMKNMVQFPHLCLVDQILNEVSPRNVAKLKIECRMLER